MYCIGISNILCLIPLYKIYYYIVGEGCRVPNTILNEGETELKRTILRKLEKWKRLAYKTWLYWQNSWHLTQAVLAGQLTQKSKPGWGAEQSILLERIEEADSVVECPYKMVNVLFSVVEVEASSCACTDS